MNLNQLSDFVRISEELLVINVTVDGTQRPRDDQPFEPRVVMMGSGWEN